MRFLIVLILSATAMFASACVAVTGGTVASPSLWSTTGSWTSCAGRYPGQSGVDTVTIPASSVVSLDVNVSVGNSGAPIYWYPYLTGNGGSGFTTAQTCGGGLSTTSNQYRTPGMICLDPASGSLNLQFWDHGYYTTSAMPTLTALSQPTSPHYVSSLATNPVTLTLTGNWLVSSTGWPVGSSQVVKVSGYTGNWTPLNGTQTLTVVSDDIKNGAVVSIAGINATAFGAVTGVPVLTSPSVTIGAETGSPTWALATLAGGGTPSIQINHLNANSGVLILAANRTLTVRGDIAINSTYPETTAVIIQKSGAHLVSDSSLYVGSPVPDYAIVASPISTANNKLSLYDASDCVNATKAGTDMVSHTGECLIQMSGGVGGVALNWRNVFVQSGSATSPATSIGMNAGGLAGMTIYNSQFYKSGSVTNSGEYHSGSTEKSLWVDVQGSVFLRGLNEMPVYLAPGTGSGTRSFSYNYVSGAFNWPASFTTQFAGPITNNFIGGGMWLTSQTGYVVNDNITRQNERGTGYNSYGGVAPSADHNMMWQDMDGGFNQKWIGCTSDVNNMGWIGHMTGPTWGDAGEVGCVMSYLTMLPAAQGFTGARIESIVAGYRPLKPYLHNTSAADTVGDGLYCMNENGNIGVSTWKMKSNLGWIPSWASMDDAPGDQHWFKVNTVLTPGQLDGCAVGGCDYNSAFGATQIQTQAHGNQCGTTGSTCPNQGNGYGGNWSVTPGAHDVDVAPYLVDGERNLLWYDIGTGTPVAAAWSSGATYHYGDAVSDSYKNPTVPRVYYNGRVFNYRCKVDDCTGAPEPGRVDLWSTWRKYWMFGGQWKILQDVIAYGNTAPVTDTNLWGRFSLGTGPHSQCSVSTPCSATQAAMGWILAGQRPRNPALLAAGHDGGTIGAMPGAPLCTGAGVATIRGSIGKGCSAVGQ